MTLNPDEQLALAIAVNIYLEAKKRISDPLKGYTYFGKYDVWKFRSWRNVDSVSSPCPECSAYHNLLFHGNELRTQFPYLEIINFDLMTVSVHPNCRCVLIYWGKAR